MATSFGTAVSYASKMFITFAPAVAVLQRGRFVEHYAAQQSVTKIIPLLFIKSVALQG